MDEEKLIKIIKPYMMNCRAGDWNHAKRVVSWIKKLSENNENLDLLVTAGYIHDIGWTNVLPKGKVNFKDMLRFESQANNNTKKYVTEVLKQLNYSDNQIQTIIRLISAADKHDSKEKDEEIIVDADNLSKLCVEHVKEKYTPESYKEIVNLWKKEFSKRLKTKKGKEIYIELLDKLSKDLSI